MTGLPGKRGRWIAALTAMAGLVLQMLAVVNHTQARAPFSPPGSVAGLQSVLICTAHGTQSITLDADGNPIEIPLGPGDPGSRCLLCNVPGSLALAGPVDGPALEAPHGSHVAMPIVPDAVPAGRSAGIHRNRGPPSRSIA